MGQGIVKFVVLYNCFYLPYNSSNLSHVFGYNLTLEDPNIAQAVVPSAIIYPPGFNGQQPEVFDVGYHEHNFSIGPMLPLYDQIIFYLLDGSTVTIPFGSDGISNLCAFKYNNTCPPHLEGFCGTGAFCSGPATCQPNLLNGSCIYLTPVVCPPGTECHDTTLSCLPTETPSNAPTLNPPPPTQAPINPTSSPTSQTPTLSPINPSQAPTSSPTFAPTFITTTEPPVITAEPTLTPTSEGSATIQAPVLFFLSISVLILTLIIMASLCTWSRRNTRRFIVV